MELTFAASLLFPFVFRKTVLFVRKVIPVKEEYPKGGYEVSVANCSDAVDDILTRGIRELLGA